MTRYDELRDISRIDTEELAHFLQSGKLSACHDAVESFLESVHFRQLESMMLRLYITMDIYMTARNFSRGIGIPNEQFVSYFGSIDEISGHLQTLEGTTRFLHDMTAQCIRWRMEAVSESGHEIVRRAKHVIDNRYMDPELSLSAVAASVGFSAPYLSTIFKREMKQNFSDYLTGVRIQRAKELLCCTTKMIYEVAVEVGFRDYRYFSQIFKKRTGQTPRAFQNSTNLQ